MSDHLLAEMDAIADALRANDPTLRESLSDELQLEFRQLQKRRMPQLGRDQFLDLFHVWRDGYLARLEAELTATRKRMAENWLRRSPSATPAILTSTGSQRGVEAFKLLKEVLQYSVARDTG